MSSSSFRRPATTSASSSSPLLITLGGLSVQGIGTWRSKPLLLLTYLALAGPTSRRQLWGLLWPEAAQPDASLRVALSALRSKLPAALEGSGASGELLTCGLPCDAAQLLTATGQAALDGYPAAFLEGVRLEEVSTEFVEWAEEQRERLGQHARLAALTLADRATPAEAARLAERAYRLPGAPLPAPDLLRRLLQLSAPGSALETELTVELAELEGEEAGSAGHGEAVGSELLGRGAELDTLLAWCAQPGGGVAQLNGPGGIGKSTLAREVLRSAHLTGRTVLNVDGEGATSLSALSARLVGALKLSTQPQALWYDVRDALGEHAVVVLDGLERVSDLETLTAVLRREVPTARWLLTSQVYAEGAELSLHLGGLPLPLPGTPVAELALNPAAALLVREARRSVRGFAVTAENASVVVALTGRLGGHPLAVLLAASWLRVEELAAVAARVLRSPATLRDEGGEATRRGLEAVLGRSWELLGPQARQAAAQLSVFADFRREDALALGVAPAALREVETASLLDGLGAERSPGHPERLRLYPALVGGVQLLAGRDGEDLTGAYQRHSAYYLTWLAQPGSRSGTELTAELPNLLQAAAVALAAGRLSVADSHRLMNAFEQLGLHEPGADALGDLARQASDLGSPAPLLAELTVAQLWLMQRTARYHDAQTLAYAALDGPVGGLPAARMKVLNILSSLRFSQGEVAEASALVAQAGRLAEELNDVQRVWMYQGNAAVYLIHDGQFGQAEALICPAIQAIEQAGNHSMSHFLRVQLLTLQVERPGSELSTVLSDLEALRAEVQQSGHIGLLVSLNLLSAHASLQLRQVGAGLAFAQSVVATCQRTGDRAAETMARLLEAQALYGQGRSPQARRSARLGLELSLRFAIVPCLIETLLTTALDVGSRHAAEVAAALNSVARDRRASAYQQRRAAALLAQLRLAPEVRPAQSLPDLGERLLALIS